MLLRLQDPVLFGTTLSENLDPEKKRPESDLWKALELAHLKDFVQGLGGELEYDVSEGGETFR